MNKNKGKWWLGRKSICGERLQAKSCTFNLCPDNLKGMNEFCKNYGIFKSQFINEAIRSYLALNAKNSEKNIMPD